MDEIKKIGGLRIGLTNVTSPFASLTVTKNLLTITSTTLGIGNLKFGPSDIITLETHSGLFNNGLRISHRVKEYSDKVIFWTSDPLDLINEIKRLGFWTDTNKEK
jgi:hypothetical protein